MEIKIAGILNQNIYIFATLNQLGQGAIQAG